MIDDELAVLLGRDRAEVSPDETWRDRPLISRARTVRWWKVEWNLLIVEDDVDISDCLAGIFESRGYRVGIATNGLEAIALVTREGVRPDVILLDLRMPVMNGVEFLDARRSVLLLATSHVIIMTAQPGQLDEIDEVVFARVTKPVRLDAVLALVERACLTPVANGPRRRAG